MQCASVAWRVLGPVVAPSIVCELLHSRPSMLSASPCLGNPELAPWDMHKATSA